MKVLPKPIGLVGGVIVVVVLVVVPGVVPVVVPVVVRVKLIGMLLRSPVISASAFCCEPAKMLKSLANFVVTFDVLCWLVSWSIVLDCVMSVVLSSSANAGPIPIKLKAITSILRREDLSMISSFRFRENVLFAR